MGVQVLTWHVTNLEACGDPPEETKCEEHAGDICRDPPGERRCGGCRGQGPDMQGWSLVSASWSLLPRVATAQSLGSFPEKAEL